MKVESRLSGDLTVLAEAFTAQIKSANRTWAFAATMMLLVLTVKSDNGAVGFLGFSLAEQWLYPAGLVLLALTTVTYCSLHLQAYFALKIFYALRDKHKESDESFAAPYSFHDATDSMLSAQSFDRVHPFVRVMPRNLQGRFFRTIKWIIQFIYYPVPFIGCAWCGYKTFAFVDNIYLQLGASALVLLIPASATLLLWANARGWIRNVATLYDPYT